MEVVAANTKRKPLRSSLPACLTRRATKQLIKEVMESATEDGKFNPAKAARFFSDVTHDGPSPITKMALGKGSSAFSIFKKPGDKFSEALDPASLIKRKIDKFTSRFGMDKGTIKVNEYKSIISSVITQKKKALSNIDTHKNEHSKKEIITEEVDNKNTDDHPVKKLIKEVRPHFKRPEIQPPVKGIKTKSVIAFSPNTILAIPIAKAPPKLSLNVSAKGK